MDFYAGKVILHPALQNPTLVIITDGYANMDTELAEELTRQKANILTILFG